MPAGIKGYTIQNEDDSYSVFLNAKISYENRIKTYLHELNHIKGDDFNKDEVQEIETDSHKFFNQI